jgi:class 3 adenylate cyclase
MQRPETQYAKSSNAHIAYQVIGDGAVDMIFLAPFGNIEHFWRHPLSARFLTRLSSFCRLISMDFRGMGLSDRFDRLPTFDEQMDDVRAVQDAVGSERSALFAVSQGGPLAMLFAATYPDRVSSLVLYAVYARLAEAPDYPWGRPPGWMDQFGSIGESGWGSGVLLPIMAPTLVGDETFLAWWAEGERLGFSPGGFLAFLDIQKEVDVRDVLPTISVPVLVLQRAEDTFRDPGHSRYIAEHIPEARYVQLTGRDHVPFVGDMDRLLDEIEEFLTGARPVPEPDRVLATVLFTDIVDSTRRAAEMGDRDWREVLADHDGLVRQELDAHRGREVKTTGDGFLATFDGPARAIRCATAIRDAVRLRQTEIRAGLHTGEIELIGKDIGGIAVHLASRVMARAGPGEVLVSSTVKDLVVGSGIDFEDRGEHALKGVPGEWHLYSVKA